MTLLTFPKDFLWGTATASYQIEGYPLADGAGPSIWHRFSHTPGNIRGGHNGDLACEHYRRYPEDIALMKSLGIQGYRMSTAWPRVLPEGRGRINEAGLDFYDRLVDALLEADITPYVTLYHWDLPSDLQDLGGWTNPAMADWFTEYASIMFTRLGDRVKNWITLNEPSVVMDRGHVFGQHAPGIRDIWAALRVAHNQLVAHGRAVQAFRASGADGEIGIALNLHPQQAATDSEDDIACAVRTDAYYNRLFMDPIFKGEYPAEVMDWFGEAWPNIGPSDLDEISTPIDFLGVNYYFPQVVAHKPGQGALHSKVIRQPVPHTDLGWQISPEGLYDALRSVQTEYGNPKMFITENGAAFDDHPDSDGVVADDARLDYIRVHLAAAHRAIADGANLQGYFLWTLLDNFEWAYGYDVRFGVTNVDHTSQKRTVKRSGKWYADAISRNGVTDA